MRKRTKDLVVDSAIAVSVAAGVVVSQVSMSDDVSAVTRGAVHGLNLAAIFFSGSAVWQSVSNFCSEPPQTAEDKRNCSWVVSPPRKQVDAGVWTGAWPLTVEKWKKA